MKRFLAMLLAVLMIVSLLPTAAFAEEVEQATPVARVGDVEYTTIEDALAAWGAGKTLTLLADVETSETYKVTVTRNSGNWTLNLGDYTWSTKNCNAIQLFATGGTAIDMNQGLTINANEGGGINAGNKYCVEYKNDSDVSKLGKGYRPFLKINGGTYTGSYIHYYTTSAYSSTPTGAATTIDKGADGSVPVINGKLALGKCIANFNAGIYNGDINVYVVTSTSDVFIYAGCKFVSLPKNGNDKIVHYDSRVLYDDGEYWNVLSAAPETYGAKVAASNIYGGVKATSPKGSGYSITSKSGYTNSYVYFANANLPITAGFSEVILGANATADAAKSLGNSTFTLDATAEGADYTGTVTLSGTSSKFVIKGQTANVVSSKSGYDVLLKKAEGVNTYTLVKQTEISETVEVKVNGAVVTEPLEDVVKEAQPGETISLVKDTEADIELPIGVKLDTEGKETGKITAPEGALVKVEKDKNDNDVFVGVADKDLTSGTYTTEPQSVKLGYQVKENGEDFTVRSNIITEGDQDVHPDGKVENTETKVELPQGANDEQQQAANKVAEAMGSGSADNNIIELNSNVNKMLADIDIDEVKSLAEENGTKDQVNNLLDKADEAADEGKNVEIKMEIDAQPKVTVKDIGTVNNDNKFTKIVVDIEPVYTMTLTTTVEGEEPEVVKVVTDKPLDCSNQLKKVSFAKPEGLDVMETSKIVINHVKDNGDEYKYSAKLKDGKIEFENPHGFSEFTVEVINHPEGKVAAIANPSAAAGYDFYDSLQDAFNAATAGQTVIMLEDCTSNSYESTYIDKDIIFNLNGNTLSGSNASGILGILSNATIENGTIKNTSTGFTVNAVVLGGGSLIVREDVKFVIDVANNTKYAVNDISGFASVNLSSGEYAGIVKAADVTITDGEFSGAINATNSLNISGGVFNAQVQLSGNSNCSITGGTFNAAVSVADGSITGGKFKVKPADAKLAENMCWSEADAQGYYSVLPAVAQVNSKNYATVEAAVAAASGKTVTILADDMSYTMNVGDKVRFNEGDTYGFEVKAPAGFTVNVTAETAQYKQYELILNAPTVDAASIGGEYKGADYEATASSPAASVSFKWFKGDAATACDTDATLNVKDVADSGTYTVKAYVGNYESAGVTVTVAITQKAVTIKADDATKVYGEVAPTLTATVTGAVGGDQLAYAVNREAGENVTGENPLTITVTADATAAVNANYIITTETGAFSITKRPVAITADNVAIIGGQTPTYTGSVQLATDEGAGAAGLMNANDLGEVTYSAAAYTGGTAEATYEITANYTANGNYEVTVNKGTLTVTGAVAHIADKDYYPTLQAALDAAADGDEIILDANISAAFPESDKATYENDTVWSIEKSITLNGNNHTITVDENNWNKSDAFTSRGFYGNVFNIGKTVSGDSIDVTVKNLTIIGKGDAKNGISVTSDKSTTKATLENVTVSGFKCYSVVCNGNLGTEVIIQGENTDIADGGWGAVDADKANADLEIKAGTVATVNAENGKTEVSGGNVATVNAQGGETSITGGTVENLNVATTAGVTVTGGTVTNSDAVAKIGSVYYKTLADAIAAADTGAVIEIVKDGSYSLSTNSKNLTFKGYVGNEGKVVFDFSGGYPNLSAGSKFENTKVILGFGNYRGFQHSGKIEFKDCDIYGRFSNYGDMQFTNCNIYAPGTTEAGGSKDYFMWIYGGGTVQLDNCDLFGAGKFFNVYNEGNKTPSNLILNGCEFTSNEKNKAAVNIKESMEAAPYTILNFNVEINDCEVTNPENFPAAADSNADTLYFANGLAMVDDHVDASENGNNIQLEIKEEGVVTDSYATAPAVAFVSDLSADKAYYTTLEKAVAAAASGGTVTLLDNCSGGGIVINKSVTVDFAGKTYTVAKPGVGSNGTETIGFQILEGNTVEFKNGTIDMPASNVNDVNGADGKPIKMLIQNYADLTLTGMTLDGTNINDGKRYVLSTNAGDVVIDGTTIIANDDDIAFDVYDNAKYTDESNVTVTGNSVINGTVELSGGSLAVTGGKFEKDFVEVTGYSAGDVAISGGEFKFTNPVKEEYCAEGYIPTKTKTGDYYGVYVGTHVAQIGDEKFDSFTAALEGANKLSGNVVIKILVPEVTETVDKVINLKNNTTITTDLEGGAVINLPSSLEYCIEAYSPAVNLVIAENITLNNLGQTIAKKNFTINGNVNGYQIWTYYGGNVTINPTATVKLSNMFKMRGNGTVTVNGNFTTGEAATADYKNITPQFKSEYFDADNNGTKNLNLNNTYVQSAWYTNNAGILNITLDNSILRSSHEGGEKLNMFRGTLTLKNGSRVIIDRLGSGNVNGVITLNANDVANIEAGSTISVGTVASSGTINIGADVTTPAITANTFNGNSGTINVDMTGVTIPEGGLTVIDFNGTGTPSYGTYTLTGDAANKYALAVVDKDLKIVEANALVNGQPYYYINDAFAAVNGCTGDNVTIKLLKPSYEEELTADYEFDKNVTITTDLESASLNLGFVYEGALWALNPENGHTLTIDENVEITNLGQLFSGYNPRIPEVHEKLVIKGDATLQQLWAYGYSTAEIVPGATVTMGYGDGMIKIRYDGTLTVTGNGKDDKQLTGGYVSGDYDGDKTVNLTNTCFDGSAWVKNGGSGTFTINLSNAALNTGEVDLGTNSTNTINMDAASTVKTGKFTNVDTINVNVAGATADRYVLVDMNNTSKTQVSDFGTVNLLNVGDSAPYVLKVEDGDLVLVKAVAKIGTTYFEKLSDAVNAAVEGDTIELIKNAVIEEGEITLPNTFKGVTFKGAEGASLKNTVLAQRTSGDFENITFNGVVFDNSRILLVDWSNGSKKNLTVEGCTFRNIVNGSNEAPINLNLADQCALNGLTFKNNVIDGVSGSDISGIYGQVTGKVEIKDNVFNNIAFRPYLFNIVNYDGIDDELIVTGNTFSENVKGRAQAAGQKADGTDNVNLVITENIFKGIDPTKAQQICYWNFNPDKTTTDFAKNYYDINTIDKYNRFYYNSAAASPDQLHEFGIYPCYTELNEDGTIDESSLFNPVAVIGTTGYESLAEAIAAVTDSTATTITMIADVEGASGISVPSGRNITVDFNGHSYSVEKPGAGSANTMTQAFQLLKDSTIVFKNGTISCTAANKEANTEGTIKPIRMLIQNYANLTLENMTIDGTNLNRKNNDGSAFEGARYVVSNNSGTVVLDDTTIKAASGDFAMDTCKNGTYAVPAVTLNGSTKLEGNVELSGGSLTIPADTTVVVDGSFVEASGYADGQVSIASGSFKDQVPFEYCAAGYMPSQKNAQGMYSVEEADAVAVVTGEGKDAVYYTDFRTAMSKVAAGDTVTLLENVELHHIGNSDHIMISTNITLDGNGKTIKWADTTFKSGYGQGIFRINNNTDTGTIEFKNLTIDANGAAQGPETPWLNLCAVTATWTVDAAMKFNNVTFVDCDSAIMTSNAEVVGCTFENCKTGIDGTNQDSRQPVKDYVVRNSAFTDCGYAINNANYPVKFTGNTLDAKSAIKIKPASAADFTGNTFNGGYVLLYTNYIAAGEAFEGNTFNGSDVAGASNDLTISGTNSATKDTFIVSEGNHSYLFHASGNYYAFDISGAKFGAENDQQTAFKVKFTNGTNEVILPEGYAAFYNAATVNSKIYDIDLISKAVAKNGDVYYTSINDAIADAKSNTTVELLQNCTVSTAAATAAKVTGAKLDLKGKTLTLNEALTVSTGAKVAIVDTASTKGGVICKSDIIVAGELDVSELGYGTSGLVGNQPGSLVIGSNGKVTLPEVFAGKTAGWINANSSTFFKNTEAGALLVNGGVTYVWNNGRWEVLNAVAGIKRSVNSVEYYDTYATLEAAFADAKSGETVELFTDCTVSNAITISNKTVVLDLAGKNLTGNNGKTFKLFDGANLTVNGTDSTITGVRFNVGNDTNNAAENASLTLNGGDYSIANNTVVHVDGDSTAANVTINGATITSDGDNGIQLSGGGTYTITDSEITGATAVYIKAGTLNVSGSKLTGNMDPADYSYYGNGANATGDAIVIDSCGYPGGAPTVTIGEGNTISGTKKDVGVYQYNNNVLPDVTSTDKTLSLPDGYAWNAEGKVVVAAAKIGNAYYASINDAVAAAQSGDEIDVLMNTEVTAQVIVDKSVTLDLNGKTVEYKGAQLNSGVFGVKPGATLTINDSSDPSTGAIKSGEKAYAAVAVTVKGDVTSESNKACVVVNGGTLEGYYYGITGSGNATRKDTVITVNDGTVKGTKANDSTGIFNPNGELAINGGVVEGATGVYVKAGNVSVVTGGTINGVGAKAAYTTTGDGFESTGDGLVIDNAGYPGGAPNASITGGSFTSTNGKAVASYAKTGYDPIDKFVSGGTFSSAVDEAYCAEGYVPVKNADGTYGVDEADDYVAEVGGLYYKTLAEAVKKAQNNDTVTLVKDASGDGIALMTADAKTVTIDLNEKTYDVTGELVGSNGTKSQAFHFEEGNTVTIKNGTLTSDKARMFMQNYADLTLDNVTLDGTNMPGTGRYVLSNNSGDVVLKDTTINAKDGDFAMDTCKYASYAIPEVTVEGKSTINGDVELSGGKLALENGALLGDIVVSDANLDGKATKADNFYAEAPDGYVWVNGVLVEKADAAVAQNEQTGVKYNTLEEALEEAENGQTVFLLKNIENEKYVIVENGVTLDLAGFSITGAKLIYVNGTLIDSTPITAGWDADDNYTRGYIKATAYMFNDVKTISVGSAAGKYVPIYDISVDGYRIVKLHFTNTTATQSGQTVTFTLSNNYNRSYAYSLFGKDPNYNDQFKAFITVTWTSTQSDGRAIKITQEYLYNDVFMDAVVKNNRAFTATISGLTGTATVQPKYVTYDAFGNELLTVYGPEFTMQADS